MRGMLLSDLLLALTHLLDDKEALLLSTTGGQLYHPHLVAQRAALEALPSSTVERRPYAEAIAQADARHDAYGSALWYYTEAILRDPEMSDLEREAAQRIRDAFIPQLAILKDSYATEAAQASRKRALLDERAADLGLLPLPGTAFTLATWAEHFVSAGETIGELLTARANRRAEAATEGTRREAGRLRTETIGVLTRLRAVLADELSHDPEAHRRLDAELFTFIDQLAAHREQSLRRRATAIHDDGPAEDLPAPANDAPESSMAAG